LQGKNKKASDIDLLVEFRKARRTSEISYTLFYLEGLLQEVKLVTPESLRPYEAFDYSECRLCPGEYLSHILDETEYITRASKRLSKQRFMADATLKRAFVRSIEIIGEVSKATAR
jgi:hypothetical protein